MTIALGFNNILENSTVTASSEATGFEKELAYDGLGYDAWKPTSVPATLKVQTPINDLVIAAMHGTETGTIGVDTSVEFVTNGDMSSGTTGWTAGNSATLSVVSGRLRVEYNGVSNPYAYQAIDTSSTDVMRLVVESFHTSNSPQIYVGTSAGSSDIYNTDAHFGNATDDVVINVVANSTVYISLFFQSSSAGYAEFDSVSVKRSSNLVSNGEFDRVGGSPPIDWTAYQGASITIHSTFMQVLGDGVTTSGSASQEIPTIAGEAYIMNFTVAFVEVGASARVSVGSLSGDLGLAGSSDLFDFNGYVAGGYSVSFIATGSSTWISFSQENAAALYARFDSISVYPASEDLSPNQLGLSVYGVLDRSPEWSGFSELNYLKSSAGTLSLGTGDFTISTRFRQPETSGVKYLFMNGYYSSGFLGSTVWVLFGADGRLRFRISDNASGTSPYDEAITSISFDDGLDHFAEFVRIGSSLQVRVDGSIVATGSVIVATGSLDNANASIYVGIGADVSASSVNVDGNISLFSVKSYAVSDSESIRINRRVSRYFDGAEASSGDMLDYMGYSVGMMCMGYHDLGANNASYILEWSDDDVTYVEAVGLKYPFDNSVIIDVFESMSKPYWRLTIDGAVSKIGHFALSESVEQRGMPPGFSPMNLSRDIKSIITQSEGANDIGFRNQDYGSSGSINMQYIEPWWMRYYWNDFVSYARRMPISFQWDDANYPSESALVRIDGDMPKPRYQTPLYIQVNLKVRGRS